MYRDLPIIFYHQAHPHRVILGITQKEQHAKRPQVLANCSQHFRDELFGRGFSREHVDNRRVEALLEQRQQLRTHPITRDAHIVV